MHRFATLSATLLLSFGAAAQDEVKTDKLDPGFLSAYSEYDSNGDGLVTLAEVEAIIDPAHVRGVRACDTDGDTRLSVSEYDACNSTTTDPASVAAPR